MIDQNTTKPRDRVQAEFDALPLEQKFASLFKMEAATVTEAFNMLVNSPMKVVEKVGDALSDLGAKIETEARRASERAKKTSPNTPPQPRPAKTKRRVKKTPKPPMG